MHILQTKTSKDQTLQRDGSRSPNESSFVLSQIKPDFGGMQSHLIPFLLWMSLLAWLARISIFVRKRDIMEFAAVDILAGIQISLVLLIFAIAFLSARAIQMWSKTAGTSVRMLFIYYFICALSLLWSARPDYTIYRAFEFITLFMGVLIALSYSPNFLKAERMVLIISSLVIVMTLIASIKLRGFSDSLQMWHRTSYSAAAAMLLCYCLGEYLQSDRYRKKILKWFGLFALCALVLATSAGSNVAVMFGIFLIAYLRRNVGFFILGVIILAIAVPLMLFMPVDYSLATSIVFPGKSEEQILTLSGRLPMWQSLVALVYQSPIIGHGFAVISTPAHAVVSINPHNSLFSVLLGTGALGLLIVLVYSFRLLREFRQTAIQYRLPGAIGCAAAITTGLINSLTTPFVFGKWEEATFVFALVTTFFLLFVVLPFKQQKIKTRKAIS